MSKKVFYDTNIYIYLSNYIFNELNDEDLREEFISKWKKLEKEKNYEPTLSQLVVFELISHLKTIEDPSFNQSLNSIKVMTKHLDNNLEIIPFPDIYFSEKFYNKSPSKEEFILIIKEVVLKLSTSEPPFDNSLQMRIDHICFMRWSKKSGHKILLNLCSNERQKIIEKAS